LSDSYDMRYSFYINLSKIVDRIILRLELDSYSFSEIKLTEDGITALTEFIMAIENNNKYVEVDINNPKLLQDRFGKLFGITGAKFSKKRNNLENGIKIGNHLSKLVDYIQNRYKKK
jgi:hypothetical protein